MVALRLRSGPGRKRALRRHFSAAERRALSVVGCASAACNFIKLPYELIDVRVRVRVMSFIDELTTSSSS